GRGRWGRAGAVARMEALGVDAVVDHGQAARRHAVERLDLAPPGLGDRDDARRTREDPALERQHDPVVEAAGPRPGLAGEIGPMAALPRAVDVLTQRALVALHHVPARAGDPPPR